MVDGRQGQNGNGADGTGGVLRQTARRRRLGKGHRVRRRVLFLEQLAAAERSARTGVARRAHGACRFTRSPLPLAAGGGGTKSDWLAAEKPVRKQPTAGLHKADGHLEHPGGVITE